MAYIGRDTDKISNVEVLDNITFNGSSSYTLQKGGSNFTPSSANTLLLSIDGVVQAGNFTVSGSTIDFGTAVAGTSTCDFVLHYGVGLITAPSDATVTTAKIVDGAVTSAKLASGTGGKVLQVVTATHSTTVTQTASSYATSGLSAAITPSASSSKVLVLTSSVVTTFGDGSNSSGRRAIVGLFRGTVSGTKLQEHFSGVNVASATTSTQPQSYNTVAFSYLDSPSTTDATTYTVGISGNGACDIAAQPDSDMSTITLLEVAG